MTMPGFSLRTRLLAGVAGVAVVLLAVSVVVTATTRTQLIEQVDARLESFSPAHSSDNGRRPEYEVERLPSPSDDVPGGRGDPFGERVSDVYQGYITADGELRTIFAPNFDGTYAAPEMNVTEVSTSTRSLFTVAADDGVTYRVLAQPTGDVVAVTAIPIDDVESTIARLLWVEVLGSLAILATLALVGWWVVHLGIRPIKEMTETATLIAGGDLDVRVQESAPNTESGQLAIALNRMLGSLGDSLDERASSEARLRQFVADASHELRTPVTTIRGYAELYRHGGLSDQPKLDDAMRRTEQEAARMGRLVDDMLTLAKLDQPRARESRPVDLAQLARDVGVDAAAAAPDRPITCDAGTTSVIVSGDDDQLRQVLANVVGNALVHTASDVPIDIRLITTSGEVVIEVADAGQGIAADAAQRVTERFFRVDPSRSRHQGGSGLGLSIVEATVAAHGGTVEIDSEPGLGTTVRLRFTIE